VDRRRGRRVAGAGDGERRRRGARVALAHQDIVDREVGGGVVVGDGGDAGVVGHDGADGCRQPEQQRLVGFQSRVAVDGDCDRLGLLAGGEVECGQRERGVVAAGGGGDVGRAVLVDRRRGGGVAGAGDGEGGRRGARVA